MDESKTSSSAAWTRGIQFFAALPFLLSLFFHAAGVSATQPAGDVDLAPLAFHQYSVNLREVAPSNEVFAHFSFTNTSERTVTVNELRPSCGCLRPQLEAGKTVYQPGERGTFRLRVLTANEKPGPHQYFCDVRYGDQDRPRQTRVLFRVVLPQKTVTVTPRALAFIQGNATPTEREIVISNFTGQRLDLLEVECPSEYVSVAIGEPDFDPTGQRIHKVNVTVSGVPNGIHSSLVTIRTDHPVFSQLRVPLRIQGRQSVRSVHRHAGAKQL